MRRSEALSELEVGECATPGEIKGAYRDLVKVWHPDRFGYDARLRQRAEERLQRINEAYRKLEAGDFEPEAVTTAASEAWMGQPPRARVKTRVEKDAEVRGWIYLAICLIVGAFAGYAMVQHVRAARDAAETATPVLGPSPAAPLLSAGPPDTSRAAHREEGPVRITHLSDAQMAQIETACSGVAFAPDSEENADCVRVQVSAMTGAVNMSGLTPEERRSVQRVCARAASYGKCAAAQIASLAAAPLRPDLSRMSARDRNAVERACSSARDYDGPAAYDRCVVEFEKALAARAD